MAGNPAQARPGHRVPFGRLDHLEAGGIGTGGFQRDDTHLLQAAGIQLGPERAHITSDLRRGETLRFIGDAGDLNLHAQLSFQEREKGITGAQTA
jgi:hypothetical protein